MQVHLRFVNDHVGTGDPRQHPPLPLARLDPTTSIVSSFAPASGADGSIVTGTPATCTNA
jgi:hypothetical protein